MQLVVCSVDTSMILWVIHVEDHVAQCRMATEIIIYYRTGYDRHDVHATTTVKLRMLVKREEILEA